MSFYLTVEQGDHLARIADENGFADWHTIWDHPDNAELKQTRDPNLLRPGDRVFIPDKERKTVSVATGARRRFILAGQATRLVVRLHDFVGAPIANAAVGVYVDGRESQMTTDGEGTLRVPIDPGAQGVTIDAQGVRYELRVGHLDPVEERAGAIARLRNLGYLSDESDEVDEDGRPADDALRFAVELFQLDHQLPVDGTDLGGITAKLKEVYGC